MRRVEYLELEQARNRVEELRAVIEKTTGFITIRMRRSWRITSTMR